MQSFSNKQTRKIYGEKHKVELLKQREFWDKQPVLKPEEVIKGEFSVDSGPLEKKTVEDVQKEPYALPEGFEWDIVDIDNADHMEELYQLLFENYVEDDDGYFRFNYSKDFLRWALTPPGYEKDMLIAIRSIQTKNLVGFISGIFINLKVSHCLTLDRKETYQSDRS